jgi:hypothetical protein
MRPKTGADSVPFPDECRGDGPGSEAAWNRYWRDREAAAARETANEAVVRYREEAELLEHGGARFDDVLECMVTTFDRHVADCSRPGGEVYRGLGLSESCFYGDWQIDRMARAHRTMTDAFDQGDREAFRKAAAEFAQLVADWGVGWIPNRLTKGGAE